MKSLLIQNYGYPLSREYFFSYMIVFEYMKERLSEKIFRIFRSSVFWHIHLFILISEDLVTDFWANHETV